ncbi:MAG: rRNA maturation RNase YbeY [Candidatus Moranbacteria bacterium]|nr:rRNA maturation RNase YbeY [Candidatus Moranbacteria bacterium]
MKIEIACKTKKRIEKSFVEKVVRKTLAASENKAVAFSVSIVFADEEKIREINRKYRKIDKATDVLSFDYSLRYNKGRIVQGEIILCPGIIEKSAKENKASFKKELAFVLSHGVLHILGYRHGRKMYGIQDQISTNY